MTPPPWSRPVFQPSGRRAAALLVAFTDREVLGTPPELTLHGAFPSSAPVDALDVRFVDDTEWVEDWRDGAVAALGAKVVDASALQAASCCYLISIEIDDPADLAHLQLCWAIAAQIARAGAVAVLDAYAVRWHAGDWVAALAPDRDFAIADEVTLTADTMPTPGFGHTVHTRGMIKFARPDLIAGVGPDQIEPTARVLSHLARKLAEGADIGPGERFPVGEHRTLMTTRYEPDGTVPELNLNNEGLLLIDV
jgi:hypothetical protein